MADIDDDDIQRLLAAAEAVVAAEDDRIDDEQLDDLHALTEHAATLNAAVFQRAAEIELLRGKPINGQSREMLHWLEQSIDTITAVFEGWSG